MLSAKKTLPLRVGWEDSLSDGTPKTAALGATRKTCLELKTRLDDVNVHRLSRQWLAVDQSSLDMTKLDSLSLVSVHRVCTMVFEWFGPDGKVGK
jgi:hypothetical protein